MKNRSKNPSRPDGWHCWQSMLRRCDYANAKSYGSYGAKGITVCQRWRNSFADFIKDMGPRPSPKHSIERKDNSKGYDPDNCHWATMKEQQNNRTNNRRLTLNGRTQTMSQWADEINITVSALHQRLKRGKMTVEKALTFHPPLIEYDNKKMSATEWAKVTGMKANTISKRIKDGWTPEKALTTPVRNWGR